MMICPTCQAHNPAGARFCSNCGNSLTAPRRVEGERRLVTIMFADVVDSTAMAGRVDPEVWAEIMNGALGFMIDAVNRYEGTVGRLMGDAILALFGAPVAHEDDAVRAVRAAIDIREAAAAYAQVMARDHGLDFAVRIGITTGLSVLAVVGSATKAEYTAMGDSANLAARLQALAPPQGILIGEDTNALVRHAFSTVARAPLVVKGRAEPVATYDVVAPLAVAEGNRGVADVASPLVGRAAELGRLQESLALASSGHGGLVLVVGEAGLGKSRLVAELKSASTAPTLWLETRGVPYFRQEPYHPWRQLFAADRQASEGEGDPARLASDTAAATLTGLLSAGYQDRQESGNSGSGDMTGPLTAALAAHLAELAAAATVVVVLEDLHWFDRSSVDLVESLAGALLQGRVLLLCLMRPERDSPGGSLLERVKAGSSITGASVIDLAPLDREAAVSLLAGMLDVKDMPRATRSLILDKAEGNPFYLEEVVRSLIDSGHIVKGSEGWRVVVPITEVDVPDTLSGVLSARIDRLQEGTRRVALTASVIGREFASSLLAAVMREGPADQPLDIGADLGRLESEDLINRLELSYLDYRFKHELTRDAAYQRLLLRRRRELHARVAQELERLQGDRLERVARTLSHHYLLGERWLQGAEHGLVAATQAARLHALPEALASFEATIAALARLDAEGDGTDSPLAEAERSRQEELHVDALVGWLSTSAIVRQHEDPTLRPGIIARAEEAVARARRLGDERRLTAALVALGNAHALSGFPGTGFESLLEAQQTARRLGDDQLFLLPFWAATEIMVDDDPSGAVTQFAAVIDLARKVGNQTIEAHALGTTVMALGRLGRFDEAVATAEAALLVAEASGSVIKRADVNILVGAAYLDMGRVEEAFDHAKLGTELALSVAGKECTSSGLHLLGTIERRRRNLPEASDRLVGSIEVGRGTSYEALAHNAKGLLATTEVLRGFTKSVSAIETEIENAEASKDGFGVANLRLELATALVELGQPGAAEPQVRQAVQWFRQRLMYPYVARALRQLAGVLTMTGDEEGARVARQESQAIATALEKATPSNPSPDTASPSDPLPELDR